MSANSPWKILVSQMRLNNPPNPIRVKRRPNSQPGTVMEIRTRFNGGALVNNLQKQRPLGTRPRGLLRIQNQPDLQAFRRRPMSAAAPMPSTASEAGSGVAEA